MKFIKMHGLGNDFVVLDHKDLSGPLSSEQIKHICDRHFGVGCDQLIVMEPSEKADIFMRIYNPDGSQAEACGNATRCVAHIYMTAQDTKQCKVETLRGILPARMADDLVEVDMGPPVSVEDMTENFMGHKNPTVVNMGNPHAVFFVEDIEKINLKEIGPLIERNKAFPNRTNVEFAQILPDGQIRMRVWERSAGITLACGSGACATGVAAKHRGLAQGRIEIIMDGGSLFIEPREKDDHVLMTGPVSYVFESVLEHIG